MEHMASGGEQRSHFEIVVCLRSWWLVKAEKGFDGKEIAVAGLSNREKEARRVFTSAPILRRYDDYNLETADGINVNLHGFIDKARTEANGFSSEIFKHFLIGFPPWWEECAKKCLSKESTVELLTRNNTGREASSPRAGEHESADKDIVQGYLDSSNADKDQYLSVETVLRNQSSASIVQEQDTRQGESTSVHDTVPIVSPEAVRTSGIEAASPEAGEHETVEEGTGPGCLDSSNADKDTYPSVETVQRNHSSASDLEKQDPKQGERTAKPNRQKRMKKSAQKSWNSRSVKNDLTGAVKRKRGVTEDENVSRREPEKKSAHVNEGTPIHDSVHIVSPEAASFRRSRSGRLLVPSLEHWRNQRVLYDTDRKIIGVLGFES
ncbi:hypothetical protein Leryth_018155 [Lithospermum erythrorhizon]|nr:hypothetical protein Leryth_018155 [Lithospermum erythrorhizon]